MPARGAQFSSAARGTAGAQFLELGAGARAAAMGEAYSATADDASALYWNPAALTRIESRSATFMHAAYIASSYFDYSAYGQKLGAKGAFGAGLQYFSAGSIAQTDATGTDVGTFRPYDLALSLGYAYDFDGFSLGLAGKLIRSKVLTTAQAEAVDLGLLSPAVLDERLRLAFTMTNLGSMMRFDAADEPLPLAFRLGSSYKVTDRWLAALDLVAPRDDAPYAALGTEYRMALDGPWKLAGRAGLNSQTLGGIDGFTGVSFGVGIGHGRLAMDYAFTAMGGVGQSNRLSMTFGF